MCLNTPVARGCNYSLVLFIPCWGCTVRLPFLCLALVTCIQRRQGKFFVCGSHKRTLTRILLVIPIFISLSYNVIHNSHLISGKRKIRLAWYEMYRNWLTFCIHRTNSVNKSCLQYYILTCSKPFDYGPARLCSKYIPLK